MKASHIREQKPVRPNAMQEWASKFVGSHCQPDNFVNDRTRP